MYIRDSPAAPFNFLILLVGLAGVSMHLLLVDLAFCYLLPHLTFVLPSVPFGHDLIFLCPPWSCSGVHSCISLLLVCSFTSAISWGQGSPSVVLSYLRILVMHPVTLNQSRLWPDWAFPYRWLSYIFPNPRTWLWVLVLLLPCLLLCNPSVCKLSPFNWLYVLLGHLDWSQKLQHCSLLPWTSHGG